MRMATGRTYTRYFVTDTSENTTYEEYMTIKGALGWARDLIDIFDADARNIHITEKVFNEYGDMLKETQIF